MRKFLVSLYCLSTNNLLRLLQLFSKILPNCMKCQCPLNLMFSYQKKNINKPKNSPYECFTHYRDQKFLREPSLGGKKIISGSSCHGSPGYKKRNLKSRLKLYGAAFPRSRVSPKVHIHFPSDGLPWTMWQKYCCLYVNLVIQI